MNDDQVPVTKQPGCAGTFSRVKLIFQAVSFASSFRGLRTGYLASSRAACGLLAFALLLLAACAVIGADALPTNDYSAVDAVFSKHCLECHEAKDPEANLVLESFEDLMKAARAAQRSFLEKALKAFSCE